ncbi:MAG: complex I NDUFA9 subunit family protein [Acidobacteriia bacterium]|nr:complex I NDUFA9 subunit family protein [Terriglobia bacterium]
MNILVAGSTGLIGSHIVEELLAEGGHRVCCMSRRGDTGNRWGERVEMRAGDITDSSSVERATQGINAVVHCVQFPNHPIENPRRGWTYLEVDGRGTERMVAAARKNGVRRFVYLSGAGASPEKTEPWFRAKAMAEKAIYSSGMEYVILRPSWIYGPEDRSLNKFLFFAKWLPFVPVIGNGKNKVQPISVFDVARVAAKAAIDPKATNRTFELGGPQELTMDAIIRTALKVAGRRRFLLHQPAALMKLLASFVQYLPGRPLTPAAIDFILMEERVDSNDAEKVFEMKFVSLEEGLRRYLQS